MRGEGGKVGTDFPSSCPVSLSLLPSLSSRNSARRSVGDVSSPSARSGWTPAGGRRAHFGAFTVEALTQRVCFDDYDCTARQRRLFTRSERYSCFVCDYKVLLTGVGPRTYGIALGLVALIYSCAEMF